MLALLVRRSLNTLTYFQIVILFVDLCQDRDNDGNYYTL